MKSSLRTRLWAWRIRRQTTSPAIIRRIAHRVVVQSIMPTNDAWYSLDNLDFDNGGEGGA